MISQCLLAILFLGPVAPNDSSYWHGYASSIVAVPLIKGGQDVIHEGKPKALPQPQPTEEVKPHKPIVIEQKAPMSVDQIEKALSDVEKFTNVKPMQQSCPVPTPVKDMHLTVQEIEGLIPPPGFKIVVIPSPPVAEPIKKVESHIEVPLPSPEIKSIIAPTAQPAKKEITKAQADSIKTVADVVRYTMNNNCYAFIVFRQYNCPPCEQLHRTLQGEHILNAMYNKNIMLVKYFYIEDEQEVVSNLGITHTPSYMIIYGNKHGRIGDNGLLTESQLIEWINR